MNEINQIWTPKYAHSLNFKAEIANFEKLKNEGKPLLLGENIPSSSKTKSYF
jgi:hypothetical protein